MAALETQVIAAVFSDLMSQNGYAFDQVFARIALLQYLMIQDKKEMNRLSVNKRVMESDGGSEIEIPVENADGGTNTQITGLETVSFIKKDIISNVKYQWAWALATGVLDNKDILKTKGSPSKIASLTESSLRNWMKSMATNLNAQLLAESPAAADFHSIPLLIQDDPTASSTVGGIDQSSYSWWQNQYLDSSATTFFALMKEITKLRNTIMGSNMAKEKPNLALTDQAVFELIEAYYISKGTHTFMNTEMGNLMDAEVGRVKGMDLIWDSVPESTSGSKSRLYMINTDYLGFRVHSGRKFELSDPIPMMTATQQDGTGWTIGLGGQLVSSSRRCQGVLFDIAQSITN